MKKLFLILSILGGSLAGRAQSYELQQLILDVEKLGQFKKILSELKTGYEVLTQGYNAVRDISQGNFNLHKGFLDGLLAVSPAVKDYFKVGHIIDQQLRIVREYKTAFARLNASGYYNPDEINYIATVYNKLFDASVKNIEDLGIILTAGTLRMSDAERLQAIDRLDKDMEDKLSFLRQFNDEGAVMTLQRAREHGDAQNVQKMY